MLNLEDLKVLLHNKKFTRSDKLLIILASLDDSPKPVKRIKEIAKQAGFRDLNRWNISDILRTTQGKAILIDDGWILNAEGKKYLTDKEIKELSNLFVENAIQDLRKYFSIITNEDTLIFLNEAIICLEKGLKRAAVVLSWVGAISLLYDYIVNNKLSEFNAEAKRRDPKWKNAKNSDDLTRLKEYDFLNILEAISVIGRDIKKELQNNCLSLRNSCGHPNSLKIGETRVAAHIEILILNVFSKFN